MASRRRAVLLTGLDNGGGGPGDVAGRAEAFETGQPAQMTMINANVGPATRRAAVPTVDKRSTSPCSRTRSPTSRTTWR